MLNRFPERRAGEQAFTMVEIALCLAIIGFALVAILGVLPAGMKVQQENREDTGVTQDGTYLLEAIRSGAKGSDLLTNYVEAVILANPGLPTLTFTNSVNPGPHERLISGEQIIGLLSTPKTTNTTVTIYMKGISGTAGRQGKESDDFALRYWIRSDVVPFGNTLPQLSLNQVTNWNELFQRSALSSNLYDVRLTFRWPLYMREGKWDVGRGERVFRTMVSGSVKAGPAPFYFLAPHTYTLN